MISDILSEAVQEMQVYLEAGILYMDEPLRGDICQLQYDMNQMRIRLDAPPK